ncbi:MAG: hypothetical protein ACR2IF_00075 [Terriglobales bacterium]
MPAGNELTENRAAPVSETPVSETVAAPVAPAVEPVLAVAVPSNISQQCRDHAVDSKACRFHWGSAFLQSWEFAGVQTLMNMAPDAPLRYRAFHGKWIRNWFDAVSNIEWTRWNDGDPWYGTYVGHPLMGAVYSNIYIQNDPRGMALPISTSGAYWTSRLRAGVWSTAWAVQWKVGPLSEASVGNTGNFSYYSTSSKAMTNGTGLADFIITPAGGFVFGVGEDILDRYVITRLESVSTNPAFLVAAGILNPTRSVANMLRFKAPWYRDSRKVR